MTFWLIIDISCLLPCRMVVGSRLKLSYQEPSYIVNALWHVIPAMNAFCWIFNDISQLFCHVLWWNLECFQDDMEGLFLLEECLNLVNNLSFLWKWNCKLIFHTVSFPDSKYTFIKLFLLSILALHNIIYLSFTCKKFFYLSQVKKIRKERPVHRISFEISDSYYW